MTPLLLIILVVHGNATKGVEPRHSWQAVIHIKIKNASIFHFVPFLPSLSVCPANSHSFSLSLCQGAAFSFFFLQERHLTCVHGGWTRDVDPQWMQSIISGWERLDWHKRSSWSCINPHLVRSATWAVRTPRALQTAFGSLRPPTTITTTTTILAFSRRQIWTMIWMHYSSISFSLFIKKNNILYEDDIRNLKQFFLPGLYINQLRAGLFPPTVIHRAICSQLQVPWSDGLFCCLGYWVVFGMFCFCCGINGKVQSYLNTENSASKCDASCLQCLAKITIPLGKPSILLPWNWKIVVCTCSQPPKRATFCLQELLTTGPFVHSKRPNYSRFFSLVLLVSNNL